MHLIPFLQIESLAVQEEILRRVSIIKRKSKGITKNNFSKITK